VFSAPGSRTSGDGGMVTSSLSSSSPSRGGCLGIMAWAWALMLMSPGQGDSRSSGVARVDGVVPSDTTAGGPAMGVMTSYTHPNSAMLAGVFAKACPAGVTVRVVGVLADGCASRVALCAGAGECACGSAAPPLSRVVLLCFAVASFWEPLFFIIIFFFLFFVFFFLAFVAVGTAACCNRLVVVAGLNCCRGFGQMPCSVVPRALLRVCCVGTRFLRWAFVRCVLVWCGPGADDAGGVSDATRWVTSDKGSDPMCPARRVAVLLPDTFFFFAGGFARRLFATRSRNRGRWLDSTSRDGVSSASATGVMMWR